MNTELLQFYKDFLLIFQDEIQSKLDDYTRHVSSNTPNLLNSPLILKFNLDFKKLSTVKQLNAILNSILAEPLQSIKEIREATYYHVCFSLLNQQQHCLQPQQVHCIIRFRNLPLTSEYEFVPFQHPVRLSLSAMKCVLHSFGEKCLYIRQSIWHCPKQCPCNQNIILDGEFLAGQKCSVCNGDLSEYVVRRIFINISDCLDKKKNQILFAQHLRSTYSSREVRVFSARSVDTPVQYGQLYRDVKVKLSDELCDVDMILGQFYMLIGTYDIINQIYIAWNFYKNQ